MATSPFSKELRDEETRSGFDASDADETFELERLDGRPATIQQETVSAPAETLPSIETIPLPPPAAELPAAAPLPTPEAIDTIDRELLAMLEAELAGPRQAAPKPTTLEAIAPPPAPFVEFDDVEQANAFDFREIDAQHPSEYFVQKEAPNQPQDAENINSYAGYAAMAGNAYSEPASEQAEQRETKKEGRSRRTIYMAAAGILLAFGVGSGVYLFWPNIAHLAGLTGGKDSTALAKSANHTESAKQNTNSHTEEKPHSEQQKPSEVHEEHKDVASADSHAEQEIHPAGTKTEHETAHQQKEANAPAAATPHETVQKQTPAITKHIEATEQHPVKKKVVAHTESVIAETPPKPEPKKITENEEHTPPKVRETVSSKIGKNTAKQKVKPESTQTESAGSGSETQVYTVQVYSTPSKDDAEEWLDQLRSKQIAGGFLSNQTVRGQTWYRVRFGSYASREEAETAARRNGFSKSWIDRIK